jgi:HEAT repeat protein
MRWGLLALAALAASGCSASTDDWLNQLNDADVARRREAIRELGPRTGEAARIVPALSGALKDQSEYVRHDAALTLRKFGSQAKEAVPALTVALKDANSSVRGAASTALKAIDPEAAKKAGVK